MILDLLRVGLSPFLVAGASLAGRRWGDSVGGWLAGFPFVAGPILLVIGLEQGYPFAAVAARTALLGMVALVVFSVWFGLLCGRWGWIRALLSGWLLYLVVARAELLLDFGTAANLVQVLLAIGLGITMIPAEPSSTRGSKSPTRWDLPMRMGATMLLVCSITLAADHLGSAWSGLLTPFPIATTVLSVFAFRDGGPAAVRRFLRGFLPGLGSLAIFFAIGAWTLRTHGGSAYGLALGGALVVHLSIAGIRARYPAMR